ncbi:MAG: ribosome biogenesis GTPase YlqF [Clostridia bacterium]|nr:ribosome biogenesis GTPase YlqF [Clostridia bacterium]
MGVQWFPGHMAKTKRLIREQLRLCDAVFELLDARIPSSSRNPMIKEILGTKPRIVVLNKIDLAEPGQTRTWESVFIDEGHPVLKVDSVRGTGIRAVTAVVQKAVPRTGTALLMRPLRVMVVGIPNVGKSSFVNRLVGQRSARAGKRPGLTRGKQWIRVGRNIELLDTPGVLWAKFEDPEVGYRLAVTGAVREEVLDVEDVARWLLNWLLANSPTALKKRFDLRALPGECADLLDLIGIKRGLLLPGGRADRTKTAAALLKDFQEGRLGRFTLDET